MIRPKMVTAFRVWCDLIARTLARNNADLKSAHDSSATGCFHVRNRFVVLTLINDSVYVSGIEAMHKPFSAGNKIRRAHLLFPDDLAIRLEITPTDPRLAVRIIEAWLTSDDTALAEIRDAAKSRRPTK